MSRIVFLSIAVVILLLSSCENDNTVPDTAAEVEQKSSDTVSIPKLRGVKPELRLTKEAALAVEKWAFYNNLSQAVDSLSGNTMGELRPQIDRISKVFEEQEIAEEAEAPTMPESLKTKAIQSRVLALQTQYSILKNNSYRNKPDVDQVATAIVKMKNGMQHLNLQINEQFSVSIKEMLEEIKNEGGDDDSDLNRLPFNNRLEIQNNL